MSSIRFEDTAIPGLLKIHPWSSTDERGSFIKTFVAGEFADAGLATSFAEEYHTTSCRGVIRGLHFQTPPHDHDKIVFCTGGCVLDVVLDLRDGSPAYKRAMTFELEGPAGFGLYVPKGCAHGFCATSEWATLAYKVTSGYVQTHDAGILWSSVDVQWPTSNPIVSVRDAGFPLLSEFASPFTFEENHR